MLVPSSWLRSGGSTRRDAHTPFMHPNDGFDLQSNVDTVLIEDRVLKDDQ